MLTGGEEQALEKLHKKAIRICHGFVGPVEQTMREQGIETLEYIEG